MNLQSIRTVIIPRWIYKALLRHKVQLDQILNPDVINAVLSQDDIAEWVFTNDHYQVLRRSLSNQIIGPLFKNDLAAMPYIKEKVLARLAYNNTEVAPGTSKCYETININDMVIVILDANFETALRDITDTLGFIREYLKAHYRMMTITEVSQLPLHSLYIELL